MEDAALPRRLAEQDVGQEFPHRPDGLIMMVWTQSSAEAQPDQHIAFVRSTDAGITWSKPRIIAGPKKPGDGHIVSLADLIRVGASGHRRTRRAGVHPLRQ